MRQQKVCLLVWYSVFIIRVLMKKQEEGMDEREGIREDLPKSREVVSLLLERACDTYTHLVFVR